MRGAFRANLAPAGVLVLFFFVYYGTLGAFIPYTALYLEHIGMTGTEIGVLLSILPLVKFTLTGMWTDLLVKVNHKRTFILVCLVVSGAAPLAFIFIKGFLGAAIVMFAFSASRAGIVPTFDHYAMEFAEQSGIAYGRLRMFGSMGFIVAALATGAIIDTTGPGSFPVVFAVIGFAAALPVLLVDVQKAVATRKSGAPRNLDANMKRFFVAVMSSMVAYTFFTNYTSLKVDAVNAPQSLTGLMWASGVGLEVVLMIVSPSILSRVSARGVIVFSVLMNGLRCAVLGLFDAPAMLVAASTLHGFAYGTFHVGVLAYIARHVPADSRLAAQGTYSAFGFGLGIVIGSIASGIAYDLFGVNGMFLTGAVLSVFAALLFLRCRRIAPMGRQKYLAKTAA